MASEYIRTLFVTENTFVNDQINFVLNPALIDPRLIAEYQISQSVVVGTEFEFDVKEDVNKIVQVYTDTIFAQVTSSQNYEVTVTTPVANRIQFENTYDKKFYELGVPPSEIFDEFTTELAE
jgi:predicted alpha-1,6-mannanase (GH76 family)